MPIKDWERDAQGAISVRPLAGYETVPVQGMALLMRLQFLNPGDRPEKPSGSLQLAISVAQLPAMIEDLTLQLGRMDKGSPHGTSRN